MPKSLCLEQEADLKVKVIIFYRQLLLLNSTTKRVYWKKYQLPRNLRNNIKGMLDLKNFILKVLGEYLFLNNGESTIVLWYDKKFVTIISITTNLILYSTPGE